MKPHSPSERNGWDRIREFFFFGYRVKDGYHSESFVKNLMDHHGVRVELKDHCVWRVRSGEKIWAGDCEGMSGFSTFSDVKSYRPLRNESGDAWSLVVGQGG
jgi:hypothetical protein